MKFLSIAFLLLGTSCGYHFQEASPSNEAVTTISVPYVGGDVEGKLTDALSREFAESGHFRLVQSGGTYFLKVTVLSGTNDRIGFRYDRLNKSDERKHNLVGVESRRTVTAEVTLMDEVTQATLLGPTLVTVNEDYDYIDQNSIQDLRFTTPAGQTELTINFSEGQLDAIEGAQDDVLTPLFRKLAQKIVDGIVVRTSNED